MKKDTETIGLLIGTGDATTKEICRCLAQEGISALVKEKEVVDRPHDSDDASRPWSGQPGKDLFFNGWKLLF